MILLYPFTWIYRLLTDFRNHLYNIEYRKSFAFEVPVINVGNLTVGGTGKTPHIEYLIRLCKEKYPLATLSRGYGRRSKGFLLADAQSNATMIGDEPMQFYKKYGSEITVAVGEERAFAIPQILFERPNTQLILLDDAFQHRRVRPYLNILLCDYHRPFYQDHPFPAGRLRESRRGAKRADIVIVSKCPDDLSEKARAEIKQEILAYAQPGTPIFFSGIRYGAPVPFAQQQTSRAVHSLQSVILFSGIARPEPLEAYVQENFQLLKHFRFPDHYPYREADIEKILQYGISQDTHHQAFLSTEKDYVKLLSPEFRPIWQGKPFYYLPIEIYFLEEEEKFKTMIQKAIDTFKS